MKYTVALARTEEGFSVSCPGLPGCWSQGKTEEEASQASKTLYRNISRLLSNWQANAISEAVKALEKAGFRIARQRKHVAMTNGVRILTIPRHDPVDPHTMAGIVRDAGLTEQQFREML